MQKPSPNKKELISQIQSLRKMHKWDEMVVLCEQARKAFPADKKLANLERDAKEHYIHEKLNSKLVKDLKANKDWETLKQVALKLHGVFPESERIKKLLLQLEKEMDKTQELERNHYIKNALQEIRNIAKHQSLDEAYLAAFELLSHDPSNKSIQKLKAQLERKREAKINNRLESYFAMKIPALRREAKANPDRFICV